MGLPECGFLSLTQGETYIHKHPHILLVFCQSAPRVRKASPSSSRWNMPPWRFQKTRNRRAGIHKRNDVHPFIHISKPKGSLCVVVPTSSKWLSKCPSRLYRVYLHKCLINEVPTPATAPDSWWRLVAVWQCPPPVPPSRWRFFSKTFFSFSVSNLWTCLVLSGSC